MADIVLRDRNGEKITYPGITEIKVNTADGGTQNFVAGDAVEATVDLDFSSGDMSILPGKGELFSEVVIPQPETLVPENIVKNVVVAGIVGSYEVNEINLDSLTEMFPVTEFTVPSDGMVPIPMPIGLEIGSIYLVLWNSVGYICKAQAAEFQGMPVVAIGNLVAVGGENTGEPFAIGEFPEEAASQMGGVYGGIIPLGGSTTFKAGGYLVEALDTGGSGGGDVGTGTYFVKVLDYDGTVIAQKNLNNGETFALPTPPTHDRLVFDGWSASCEITNNTVTVENNDIIVGATYRTSSGATEIDVTLNTSTGLDLSFNLLTGVSSIDWGDGTTDSNLTHTYSDCGDYTIKIYDMTAIADGNSSNVISKNKYMITNVFFASSVTSIGTYAFYGCYSLENVVIPSSVTSIGTYAFYGCYSLENVVIPSSVTSIDNNVFQFCRVIKNIVIPAGVTSIGTYAFHGCFFIKNIVIPASVTSIGAYAFRDCYSLENIVIPAGVTSIGTYAFYNCDSLENIVIPASVTSIGAYAFYNCYSLKNVLIPSSVTSIDNNTFYGCYSLENIVIPAGVTSIGNSAFYNCSSLENIVIPAGVTSIGTYAFFGCGLIINYDFSACVSIPTLSGTNAFTSINGKCTMLIPSALYNGWKTASNWSTYAKYMVAV